MPCGRTGVELYGGRKLWSEILSVKSAKDTVRTVRFNEHPPLCRHCRWV